MRKKRQNVERERKRRMRHGDLDPTRTIGKVALMLRYARWETLISSDPEDVEIDIVHGFYPWEEVHPLDHCRNGCGLSAIDVISAKVLECHAPQPHNATKEIRATITELEREFTRLGSP